MIDSVSFVENAAQARKALEGGSLGVFLPTVDAILLEDAIQTIAKGFVVIDPAFIAELFPPIVGTPVSLSPRQLEVLGLMSDGISNKDIAESLGFSNHTAKFHVTSIMDKLGAASRTEAVMMAVRLGLVS